jgi:hypothetical protein
MSYEDRGSSRLLSFAHALPRLSLRGSFFHAMISYRAATEGAGGNNLSLEIYEKILELSLEDDTKIPQYAWGSWPRFAQKHEAYIPSQAKVCLDQKCLLDWHDFDAGLLQGLCSSLVIICILSVNEHGRGSVGDLMTLRPSEGKDRVDTVLLELILAHELRALGEKSSIFSIVPILVGPQRPDRSFEPFPKAFLDLLSPEPSVRTTNKAASILAMLGVRDQQIQAMKARSVRQHVDLILKNQGVQASTYANQDELVRESARICLMVIKGGIWNITFKTQPARFAKNRPNGQEVIDWLREKQLSFYLPIFLHYALDSLMLVSLISRQQVSRLAEEYRDIYFPNTKQEYLSCFIQKFIGPVEDWDSRQVAVGGETVDRDAWCHTEDCLWQAIQSLGRDSCARSMTERLEWFEDSSARWHYRGETTVCVCV